MTHLTKPPKQKQHDLRQMQTIPRCLLPSPNPLRRRTHDDLLRMHKLREPMEILLGRLLSHNDFID